MASTERRNENINQRIWRLKYQLAGMAANESSGTNIIGEM